MLSPAQWITSVIKADHEKLLHASYFERLQLDLVLRNGQLQEILGALPRLQVYQMFWPKDWEDTCSKTMLNVGNYVLVNKLCFRLFCMLRFILLAGFLCSRRTVVF